jgi:transcriptional regulator with PAS, ATPase and Fis domain
MMKSINLDTSFDDGFCIKEEMAVLARIYIHAALDKADGNKTKAAKLLGLPSYQTLNNWMEKYNVLCPNSYEVRSSK